MSYVVSASKQGAIGVGRSTRYVLFLVGLMGLVAIMDQYISTVKTTAIPYILNEYTLSAPQFSWLEALYLIPTFLIFVLNGLNDIIGRRLSILILILLMGGSGISIVYLTPSLTLFMAFYALAMFTTVSNMWTIPINEEAPAPSRGKLSAAVYVIGLLPFAAVLPAVLVNVLGLDWRWMYGIVFAIMLVTLIFWSFMKETLRYTAVYKGSDRNVRRSHFFGIGAINRGDLYYIAISAAIWICWLINQFLWLWAGYYFMTIIGYSLAQWSSVLLVTLLAAMAGGLLSGYLMDTIGRNRTLIIGCVGATISFAGLGFMPIPILPAVTIIAGFFTSLAYAWIVVYIPEIFPTERRGACFGWTSTISRISYVLGPVLAALLLSLFPTMQWYWVITGLVMLGPVIIILIARPFETRRLELEEIQLSR